MRTRQKVTAIGALALATTAVGGGAVVTSHAMADTPTPDKGTMTVIAMSDSSDSAIKCVYDDVDLPVPQGHGVFGTEMDDQLGVMAPGAARAFDVIAGTGPVDVNGEPVAGGVIMGSTTMSLPDGQVPSELPNFTIAGPLTGPTAVAGGNEFPVPPLPFEGVVLDVEDARPGTDEECAALKPTAGVPPMLTAP